MSQASQDITQQFKNGGVVPGQLNGQNVASTKYVDDQSAIRDGKISVVASAVSKAQGEVDALGVQVNNIVSNAGNSNTEIVDARGTYPILSARLNAADVQLTDKANKSEVTTIIKNVNSRGINVLSPPTPLVAAVGDGVADDTAAIQNIINYCTTNKLGVIIPQSSVEYKITGRLDILKPISIDMDSQAQIKFYPATATNVLFYINTMTNTIFNWGTVKLGKLVSATPLNGVAVQIDSCGAKNVYVHFLQGFKKGFYLTNSTYNCLGNEINFDLMTQCETGAHVLSSANMMEGNVFKFNFITEGKYGIILERSGAGSCSLNQFFGNAVHMTLANCIAIYIPLSTNLPYGNEFNIKGFIGADNGLVIGGNRTQGGETDYAWGRHNVFRIYCNSPASKVKLALMNEVYNNYNIYSHAVSDAGYTPSDTAGEASFNGSISLNTNNSMFSVTLPAGTSGAVLSKFAYHQFLGHADPKVVQIIPISRNGSLFPSDTFLVQAFDNSATTNREFVLRIAYLKTTTAPITIKFYASIV